MTQVSVRLDGVHVAVERLNETSMSGRSLLIGDLHPLKPTNTPSTTGALQEAATAGWHSTTVGSQHEWLQQPQQARTASAADRGSIKVGDDATMTFGIDENLLRPPWPIDLIYTPPLGNHPPYAGPRAARLWLGALQPQPGEHSTSFRVQNCLYYRETLRSLTGGPFEILPITTTPAESGTATITDSVLSVPMLLGPERLGSNEASPGSRSLQYLVPLRSIARVSIGVERSTIRPWAGRDKKIVAERGYSPVNNSVMQVTFSDGWRISQLSFVYDRESQRPGNHVTEDDVLGLWRALTDATARAQGRKDLVGAEIPTPETRTEKMKDFKAATVDYPDAIHFGITALSEWAELIPGESPDLIAESAPAAAPGSNDPGSVPERSLDAPSPTQPPPPSSPSAAPPGPITPNRTTPMAEASWDEPVIVRVNLTDTAMEIPDLGFSSSSKNMPKPLQGAADALYVGGITKLVTPLPVLDHTTGAAYDNSGLEIGPMQATFAAALYKGTMAVIVSPLRGPGPNYWIRIPLAEADIITAGQKGMLKKRPKGVAVAVGDALAIGFFEVNRFWPNREAMQPWQEGDLVEQLMAQQA